MLCRQNGATAAYTPMLHARIFSEDPKYRAEHFTTCAEDRCAGESCRPHHLMFFLKSLAVGALRQQHVAPRSSCGDVLLRQCFCKAQNRGNAPSTAAGLTDL